MKKGLAKKKSGNIISVQETKTYVVLQKIISVDAKIKQKFQINNNSLTLI